MAANQELQLADPAKGHRMSRRHWAQKVMDLQSQRNPEEIKAAQSRIELARQHEVCARKCKAVKGLAVRSRALAAEGLNQMAMSSAPDEYVAVQDRWRCAQEASRARQEKKCRRLGKTKFVKRARKSRSRSASRSASESGDDRSNMSLMPQRRRGRAARREHAGSQDGSQAHGTGGSGSWLGWLISPGESAHVANASGSDSDMSRSSSPEAVLRAASDSEEDAMEEAAGLVGASDAAAMALVATSDLAQAPEAQSEVRAGSGYESYEHGSEGEDLQRPAWRESDSDSNGSGSDSDVAVPTQQRPERNNSEADAVTKLLQQLVKEPSEMSECAAKFSLYEGYASEVENMRNTLFKFHEESCPALPGAIVTDMDRQIRGIDSHEAMQIPDRSREWFVYHMMRQAERNNKKMAGILDTFDKKLKFLAQNDQVECPVCLDSFGSGSKAAETLGCCHKVCKECWQNWTKVTRGRPFCPFCRHEDFLGAVAARATGTLFDSDSESTDE